MYLCIICLDLPPLPQDVRSRYATALTLRHNTSLWYEQLDPSKVVPLLKDKFGFSKAQMKEVESYSGHFRAQATVILYSSFRFKLTSESIQNLPGHEEFVSQLMEGMYAYTNIKIKCYYYCIAGKFGREFNLVVWRISQPAAK